MPLVAAFCNGVYDAADEEEDTHRGGQRKTTAWRLFVTAFTTPRTRRKTDTEEDRGRRLHDAFS